MTVPAVEGPTTTQTAAPAGSAPPAPPRRLVPLVFKATGAALIALSVGGAIGLRDSGSGDPLTTYAVLMTSAVALGVWGLWFTVDRYLLRAAETLSREAGLITHGTAAARVPLARYGDLLPVAKAVNDLSDKLATARRDTARAVAESTAKAEEQKTRLAAVLRDLHEGVLVCNLKHQILLYNQTALDILHLTGDLGLGRSLLRVLFPTVANWVLPITALVIHLSPLFDGTGRLKGWHDQLAKDFVVKKADLPAR